MTPHVRVVRGRPDDMELAALVAGLLNGTQAPQRPDGGAARRRWRQSIGPQPGPRPGPDAWRWSARAGR